MILNSFDLLNFPFGIFVEFFCTRKCDFPQLSRTASFSSFKGEAGVQSEAVIEQSKSFGFR